MKNTSHSFLPSEQPCFSLGSAFCAQAADIGWVTEDGTWRYKDASGNYVTNTWKTFGGSSFYLGSDGKMTVNQWIDDEYYVNDSGAMVKNSWIHITEEGGSKPAGWYYTDSKESLSVMAGKPLERINMPLTATAGCVRAGF